MRRSGLTAIGRLVDPANFGVWVGPYNFSMGYSEDPNLHEVLGAGIYPVALVMAVLAWVLGRMVLVWAVRTIRGR